jgi:predicted dehydrogenase
LEFDSGCVANLTASRISTERVRKVRFFQPHQYVSVDYGKQDVFALSVEKDFDAGSIDAVLAAAAANPTVPIPGVKLTRPEVTPEEPLHAELKAFLKAVRERSTPVVSLGDGRRALAVALEINDAIAQHHRRANLDRLASSR